MGKKAKKEEGVDLSTDATLWTEEELRQLIREEALKLIGGQNQQWPTIQPNIPPPYNPPPYQGGTSAPNWIQPYKVNYCANSNSLYDAGEFKVTVNDQVHAPVTGAW